MEQLETRALLANGAIPYPNVGQVAPTVQFTGAGRDVIAYYYGSDAGYANDVAMLVNGAMTSAGFVFPDHNTAQGASVDLGFAPAGARVVFEMQVFESYAVSLTSTPNLHYVGTQLYNLYSDPALNSLDHINHTYATSFTAADSANVGGLIPQGTYVAFEDEVNEVPGYTPIYSDLNYNDLDFVITNIGGGLVTTLSVPGPLGPGQASTLTLTYTNTSAAAMPAPLLVLNATQGENTGALLTLDPSLAGQGLNTATTPTGYSQAIQILASGATLGVLGPGESETVKVYYAGWLSTQWSSSAGQPLFTIGAVTAQDATSVDWAGQKSSFQPPSISDAAWNAIYANFTAQLGSTYGAYVQQLDADAQYLAGIGAAPTDYLAASGEDALDPSQLLGFEIQQASGYSPLSSLAGSTDADVATPGLPLSFTRTFMPGVIQRNQFGPFGWGWTDSWDTYLVPNSDGSVTVFEPGGGQRLFQPASGGGYTDQPGDHGTLAKLSGGGYTLTELDGQVTAYNANGKLNYVQDTNGNRITAGYTGGLLTSLAHSSGQFLTLSYNVAGLVSAITDSDGRTTTYSYDPTNQYLVSVTDFNGQTTSYSYDTGTSPTTAHALLAVTNPDGSHDYFSYDAQGRLADAHRDGGAEDTAFSYYEGQVTATDALGDATNYYFDDRGLLLQVENPLQSTVKYAYDSDLNLVSTTDAAGQTYRNTYNAQGNLLSSTDPLNEAVIYTYCSTDDRLASLTDAEFNTTLYGYNGSGDLTSTTYADGTVASVAYDPVGNVLGTTNANGQAISYTYLCPGQVGGADFVRPLGEPGSKGVGRFSFSHKSMAA